MVVTSASDILNIRLLFSLRYIDRQFLSLLILQVNLPYLTFVPQKYELVVHRGICLFHFFQIFILEEKQKVLSTILTTDVEEDWSWISRFWSNNNQNVTIVV